MAKCDVCGNEYDKAFEIIKEARAVHSIVSNVRFMQWHPRARTVDVRSSVMAWKWETVSSTVVHIAPVSMELIICKIVSQKQNKKSERIIVRSDLVYKGGQGMARRSRGWRGKVPFLRM